MSIDEAKNGTVLYPPCPEPVFQRPDRAVDGSAEGDANLAPDADLVGLRPPDRHNDPLAYSLGVVEVGTDASLDIRRDRHVINGVAVTCNRLTGGRGLVQAGKPASRALMIPTTVSFTGVSTPYCLPRRGIEPLMASTSPRRPAL